MLSSLWKYIIKQEMAVNVIVIKPLREKNLIIKYEILFSTIIDFNKDPRFT